MLTDADGAGDLPESLTWQVSALTPREREVAGLRRTAPAASTARAATGTPKKAMAAGRA
ncbi:hypothetical protein [Streptomyces europaeiscabiei]|uniref:hypothetical protein n=1 Tax=Streptomyces europaeiscabiei TaxID=146819 RepID=UPI002E2D2B84|nr:hypothetical protein [Streptomyces europaeiscabiei]